MATIGYREDEYWGDVLPTYGSDNYFAPKGKHIMNKNEAKLCRRLMAETGLSEEELREHKKYRRMLSAAQVAGHKQKRYWGHRRTDKRVSAILKNVTRKLKLPKEHPLTIVAFSDALKEADSNSWGWRSMDNLHGYARSNYHWFHPSKARKIINENPEKFN